MLDVPKRITVHTEHTKLDFVATRRHHHHPTLVLEVLAFAVVLVHVVFGQRPLAGPIVVDIQAVQAVLPVLFLHSFTDS